MVEIPLNRSDYSRSVAKEAELPLRNRYFEANPVLSQTQTALISRPGLKRFRQVGEGPIRGIFSEPGTFNEACFVVSGTAWYRLDTNGTVTLIETGISGGNSSVSMCATSRIGEVPEYLFLASGAALYLYMDNSYAKGTVTGDPDQDNKIELGNYHYQFTRNDVNLNTPDGSEAKPFLIAMGGDSRTAWDNFANAVSDKGAKGTDYSQGVQANSQVQRLKISATAASFRANTFGDAGNGIVSTTSGGNIFWTQGATLQGGGKPSVYQIETPDNIGIEHVVYCQAYVVCVPTQREGYNGRFYWIDPGETTIDALNYATAERAPDPIVSVTVFMDQVWFLGSSTVETWYFSGDANMPIKRLAGVTLDRGAWKGTALRIKESMMFVDNEGGVFLYQNGLKKVSTPGIDERIRKAMYIQAST